MNITNREVNAPNGIIDECGYIECTQYGFLLILNDLQLLPGRYTFSIWIKSSDEGMVSINEQSESTGTEWKRYIYNIDGDNITEIVLEFQAGEYWIYHAKLESGDKATDWTPAPEDVDDSINIAQKTADGKNAVYYQDEEPENGNYKENDIWFDTDNGFKAHYYMDGIWKEAQYGTEAFAAESITAEKIAASAITAGKIAAGAITTEKLDSFSIIADKIAAGAITSDKIAANAITAGKIAAGAITSDSLSADSVTSKAISADAILTEHISSNAITGDKIAAETITATNIDVTDLIANGFIKTNKLTAANIDVNSLMAQNITAAGTIQSTNYSYVNGNYSNAGIQFDMSTGKVTSKNFSIDVSGNVRLKGIIYAETGGSIGGWTINSDSLSYGNENSGSFMLLKPSTNTILTSSGYNRSLLTDGCLKFEKSSDGQNIDYAKFRITYWADKSSVYGVGVNSEVDSKFISFGNKNTENDDSYTTVLLLNYGLNPYKDKSDVSKGERTEDILIYGRTYFDGNIYFNNESCLGALSGGGVYCGGKFYIDGDLSVVGTGVVKTLKDSNGNAHVLSLGWSGTDLQVLVDSTYFHLSTSNHNHDTIYSKLNHNLWDHTITWTDSGNARTSSTSSDSDYNLACVQWVKDNYVKTSSDERVKCNFTSLPKNIDIIFDSFKINQYNYKDELKINGYYFGDTAQHIEYILNENGLNSSDYAIVCKRPVDMDSKEKDYIKDDDFHYIDMNNIVWLCVDQIQKLKRKISELESLYVSTE